MSATCTSHTTTRSSRRVLGVLAVAALLALPGMARAQNTCNAFLSIGYVAPPPFADIGDVVRVRLSLGTGTIQGGTQITINRLRFELDCSVDFALGINCTDDGAVIEYEGDGTITTDCGVAIASGHAVSALPNQVVFTATPGIVIPANTPAFCSVEFDVKVIGLSNDSTPNKAEEVGGFLPGPNDAQCNNGLQASGSQSAAIDLCPPCSEQDTECASFACNTQTGECDPTFVPSSDPCTDNDGDLCTTAGCDGQGNCDQTHITVPCTADECNTGQCNPSTGLCIPVQPSTPCGDTDNNVCTTAGCENETPDHGICVQTHIFADDSTPCPDTDQDNCTTSGCDSGGVCDQLHIVCVTTTTTTTTSTTTTTAPCIPQPEDCTNGVDDDCDNLVDCDDPDCGDQNGLLVCQDGTQNGQSCATTQQQTDCVNGGGRCVCARIHKDPSTIKFGTPFDVFQSHGHVVPAGTIDMSTSDVSWVVSGTGGVVYSGTLHPSDWLPNTKGTVFRYRNIAARTEGGIYLAKVKNNRGGTAWGYKIKAYDLMRDKIVDEHMSIQFYIGSPPQSFIHNKPWQQYPWGWKTTAFE